MQSTWQRGHYTFYHVFRDGFGTLPNKLFLKSRMLTGSLSLCPSGSGTGKLPLPKFGWARRPVNWSRSCGSKSFPFGMSVGHGNATCPVRIPDLKAANSHCMETNRNELLQNTMTSLPDRMQSAGVAMRAIEHN